MQINNDLAD